jgi:ribokinase
VANALITLGKRGCVYSKEEDLIFSGSEDCGPVADTTAAGDSFVAAFCVATTAGLNIEDALKFANCTAGITVSRFGAQPSLPTLDEVKEILKQKNYNINIF